MRNWDLRRVAAIPGVVIGAVALLFSAPAKASEPCSRVLTVSEVVRLAPKLHGEVTCVRGVLAVHEVRDQGKGEVPAPEMTEFPHRKAGGARAATIGLADWDGEVGVGGNLYRPETLAALEPRMKQHPNSSYLEVTVRGVVMYKKRLLERARKVAKKALGADSLSGPQREVELVLLEVVKVHGPPSSAR
jgi:hypothetical protein